MGREGPQKPPEGLAQAEIAGGTVEAHGPTVINQETWTRGAGFPPVPHPCWIQYRRPGRPRLRQSCSGGQLRADCRTLPYLAAPGKLVDLPVVREVEDSR